MKLFYNPPSPYGRKAIVAAHEFGIVERLELQVIDPWKHSEEMLSLNPVGKVPALVTDDGTVIGESTTICEYFNFLRRGPYSSYSEYVDVSARTAIAQGVIDAGYTIVIEGRRPSEKRWEGWIARQRDILFRTLKAVQVQSGRFDIGDISLACGLAYLDFRLADLDWRGRHPQLAGWMDAMLQRPSMQKTKP